MESKVIDKREAEDDTVTRRRRECLKCQKRFTTYERAEHVHLTVIKKSGAKEPFSREKLEKGIRKACEKTSLDDEKIATLVDDIEHILRNKDTTEIPSKQIGEITMRKLKKADKVAYIRFASVYREFQDAEEFLQEIEQIMKKK
jgi:transcriptional repressor NrdR